MDLGTIIVEQWKVIAAAPGIFIAFGLACGGAGFLFARALYDARVDTLRDRLEGAKEEVQRLRAEKDAMLARLEGHGEDISKLKADLASLPRIHVSERPPEDPKDGDVWFHT